MTTKQLVGFSEAERDAVYAALRYLATGLNRIDPLVTPNDGDIGDILTNSGAHAGLTGEQVHDLCDELLA
jgi:hypothetical protein